MEEKESLKETSTQRDTTSPKRRNFQLIRSSGISEKFSVILKFILGILLLPFVYAATKCFINELVLLEKYIQLYFSSGIISFLILYLFVWEPVIVYKSGQRFVETIFHFFHPLVKVAPYVLPIYTIILFIIYLVSPFIYKSKDLVNVFVLLIGFSIAFHLVFSAQSLKTKEADSLRANYIFGFSLIYIINIILVSLGLSLIFNRFSFVHFFNHTCQVSSDIFKAIFTQLFL